MYLPHTDGNSRLEVILDPTQLPLLPVFQSTPATRPHTAATATSIPVHSSHPTPHSCHCYQYSSPLHPPDPTQLPLLPVFQSTPAIRPHTAATATSIPVHSSHPTPHSCHCYQYSSPLQPSDPTQLPLLAVFQSTPATLSGLVLLAVVTTSTSTGSAVPLSDQDTAIAAQSSPGPYNPAAIPSSGRTTLEGG